MKDRRYWYWFVLVSMLVLDQLVKAWVRHSLVPGQKPGPPWPGVFEITLTFNRGIAFGMAQGSGIFVAPVAIGIAVAASVYSLRHPKESVLTHVAMALLGAGAIGNLVDRVYFGQVTDMFWARIINFPVFNVADACITVAACLIIWGWLVEHKRHAPTVTEPETGGDGLKLPDVSEEVTVTNE